MRKKSAEKDIPFNVDANYLKTICPDKCPVFGTPFKYGGNKYARDSSPSVDRVSPALGYVEGNLVIVSRKANLIKSCYNGQDVADVGAWLLDQGY